MPNSAPPAIAHDTSDISVVTPSRLRAGAIFAAVIILAGVAAGTGGMVLALMLREIQHAAYGYDLHAVVSPESFLQGVTSASPMRRVIALTVCGAVAGAGWWTV